MRRRLHKVLDEVSAIRCASGPGIIREEVWLDKEGTVTRYNLAFINHFMSDKDNGRVLGYDNSHGHHHRHFKGAVEPFVYTEYDVLIDRFLDEVASLRKETS